MAGVSARGCGRVWVWVVGVGVWVQCRAPWGPHTPAHSCTPPARPHACTPARLRLHAPQPAAPTTAGRSERGAVAQCSSTHEHPTWAWGPLVDACALQSIPEGAVARVPGICERFNGLRDPSMTPTMPEQSATLARRWEFCDYLMLQPGASYPKVC
jgi:hypothetical protein